MYKALLVLFQILNSYFFVYFIIISFLCMPVLQLHFQGLIALIFHA